MTATLRAVIAQTMRDNAHVVENCHANRARLLDYAKAAFCKMVGDRPSDSEVQWLRQEISSRLKG